ncbi:long-chain-fatty-acid--CoA ligase [Eilatimonas milleporae]|uniref:3-methylmercaptopropionyl-CoA ligase n=1 Tax=Eilatimonas milleporae TaxID=911205 RepID=A0A3M0CHZ9_9PROT|nr:long-chain fatty acid--CoA ligase [Eilatimonas milleporae]RMB08455.1 long-chain acyl-CoA synthetase [Eilatimonas milleporae]
MSEVIYKGPEFGPEDLLAQHMGALIDQSVATHGDATAFSCVLPTGHAASMSYSQLGSMTDAMAVFLREELGLKPGDVVAIQAPNTLAYPVVAFGILKAGLTITNVNPLYTAEETQHQLQDSGARVLFVIDLFGDRVAQSIRDTAVEKVFRLSLVDLFPGLRRHALGFALKRVKKLVPPFGVDSHGTLASVLAAGRRHMKRGIDVSQYFAGADPHSVAFYQYTGGTTGRSKGALLSHHNVISNISQGHKRNEGAVRPGQEVMMLVLPLYHVYALAVGAMTSLHNGTHVVLVPAPRPLANLQPVFNNFDITLMPGVNTLYLGLLQENWFTRNPPDSLRYCFSGAAPLQPATAQAWEKLTGAGIYEGYGLTESTCMVTTTHLASEPKRGTAGQPLPGTELRIVGDDGKDMPPGEPGELWIRGPQVMQGYLNRPDAHAETFADGWLRTGDVAVVDDEGYLSIVDRMKDMVIVSGFNVYPTDVEDVLTRHDSVAEAAVVGAPDAVTGERVVAYIVKGDDRLTAGDVTAHCRDHLTGYKVPKTVIFVDELPKSPVGKVLRRDLRDRAAADVEAA